MCLSIREGNKAIGTNPNVIYKLKLGNKNFRTPIIIMVKGQKILFNKYANGKISAEKQKTNQMELQNTKYKSRNQKKNHSMENSVDQRWQKERSVNWKTDKKKLPIQNNRGKRG